MDVRASNSMMRHCLESDIEDCHWDRHDSNIVWYSTEDGHISCVDARKFESKIVSNMKAHLEAVGVV